MPPTTPTESADTWADPPTVNAVLLRELSYMLQPLRLLVVLPCAVIVPLALRFSAGTQPLPSPGGFIATVREPVTVLLMPSAPMKSVRIGAVAVVGATPLGA